MSGYKLQVDISSNSTLDNDIKKLKELISLRDSIKGTMSIVSDADVPKIVELINQHKNLNDAIAKTKKVVDEKTKLEEKLTKAQSNEAKELALLNLKIQEQNKANKEAAKQAAGMVTEYDKLSKQLVKNKIAVKDLVASGKELSDADRKLIKDTIDLDAKLKAIDKTFGDGHRTVGLYEGGILEASKSSGLFGGVIGTLTEIVSKLNAAIDFLAATKKVDTVVTEAEAAATVESTAAHEINTAAIEAEAAATKELSFSKKLLRAITSPTALALAALAAVLGSVITGLTKTQKGADDVSVVMEGLKSAFDEAVGSVGKFGLGIVKIFQGVGEALSQFKVDFSFDKGLDVSMGNAKEIFKDAFDTIGSAFDNLGGRIEKAFDQGEVLGKFKLQIREQNLALKTFLLDVDTNLAIQQQISNDVTLSFEKRLQAQRKANNLQEQLSAAEVKIAKNNLEAIQFELKLKQEAGVKDIELREKELQAKTDLDKAESALAIARLNEAKAEREIKLNALANELKILEKQFDKISAAREKEFESDRVTIDNKIKLLNSLKSESEKVFDEEIKRISETVKKNIDGNDLVTTSDARALRDKIRALGLGEEAEILLNKAIKARQDQNIVENQLTEKTILLLRKKQEELKKINDNISSQIIEGQIIDLQNANKAEKENFKLKEDNTKKIIDLKKEQLTETANAEIEAINKAEIEEDLKAAKILQINTKLTNDLKKLKQEETDALEVIEKERINKIIQRSDFIVGKITDAISAQSDKELERISKEQAAQEKAQERQQDRADRGLSNELELQQRRSAELEQQRQKEEQKQRLVQKVQTFYNLLSGYAKQDAKTALPNAARDMALGEAITLAFAERGGIAGEVKDTTVLSSGSLSKSHKSGDILTVMSPKEGILNEKQMGNLGSDGFYNLQHMLNNPINDDILFPKVPQFAHITSVNNNGELIKEFKELKKIIQDKPVSHSSIDKAGDVIHSTIEKGIKHTRKIISRKPSFTR